MTDSWQRNDIQRIIRSTGADPEAYAWQARLKDHPTVKVTPSGCERDEPGVQPLVTSLTNKNNVTNGYTPVASPLADVSHVIPADAIELTEGNNATASSLATPDTWLNNDDVTPEAENEADAVACSEEGPHCPVLPTPYYLKVDVFDNGAGKVGKTKSNRYKVKIHFYLEYQGNQYVMMGAFHPETRGFRNNVPEGFENNPFYLGMDDELYRYNKAVDEFRIRPLGAKFKDADNKTVIYAAAILFWVEGEANPTVILDLQGFRHVIELDERPKVSAKNNLLAYGIWLDPARRTKQPSEDKKGGNTLLETIELMNRGVKR